MKRLGLLALASITALGCGGNGQLRSEIADLRVSMDAMEARQDKLESGSRGASEGIEAAQPGLAGVEINEANAELLREIESLKATQAELLTQINNQPAYKPRPTRPRPDAASVYSVDIQGAPARGAQNAKVTIVQAFEFA